MDTKHFIQVAVEKGRAVREKGLHFKDGKHSDQEELCDGFDSWESRPWQDSTPEVEGFRYLQVPIESRLAELLTIRIY